jgi:hypothetical protein
MTDMTDIIVPPYHAQSTELRLKNGFPYFAHHRLLLINGMEDSIFPIEDNFIVARHGVNKDLLARGNRSHMGDPGGEDILCTWLDEVIAGMP